MISIITILLGIFTTYFLFIYFITLDNRSNILAVMSIPLLLVVPSYVYVPLFNYYQIGLLIAVIGFVVTIWIIKHTINGVKSIVQDYIKDNEVNNIIINLVKLTSYFILVYYFVAILNYINVYSYI